ncbi:hypothetical protein V498_05536, partial [Pseudogymnoascus sp. VKM F-4517 (FW-2822)]
FHFHITYNYFCSPIAAPLIHKWLPLFGNRMQFLTVEVDFTRVGGSYENDKCALTDGKTEILWFLRRLVLALKDRKGTIRSLHIMCRRYKGFRPPSQMIPEKNIPDDTEPSAAENDGDGTLSDNNTPTSSVIAQPSHGECSHLTDEPPEQGETPRKNAPIKYCPSSTTAVLDILPRFLGWTGIALYHFRLSGFSKAYTKTILTEVSAIGAGPPFLIKPRVPPWPRDYPVIGPGITTTDGNYLGTVVKFVNNADKQVERPPTGRLAASRMFLKRAISRISLARTTPNSEPYTPYPEYDGLSTIEDSDIESDSETITGNEKQSGGLGLGIQLPTQSSKLPVLPTQNSKYPLLPKSKVEKDIERRLDEPDLPKNPPINELWAIHSVSTRFGDLFGVDTATRGLSKESHEPPRVDSMHTAIGVLYTVPENSVVTPSIAVMTATVPDAQDQLQQINAMSSSTFDGVFSSPDPPTTAAGWSEMNRLWSLGIEYGNLSQQGLHTVATNSTLYTDASESTLDMALSDPTIPPQSRMPDLMHEQEVDSSSTLYVPDDGSVTPTMARNSNEDRGQAEELQGRGEEQPGHSQLGLYNVATGSTFSGHSTNTARSRSNTDNSVILDWPFPNPIPGISPQPTRPAPPVPEVHYELQHVPSVSSRRTVQFPNDDQLQQVPSILSRRTTQLADTDGLREVPTTSSRRTNTVHFEISEEEEAARTAGRTRSRSFNERRRKEQMATKRFEALDTLFHDSGAPPVPKEKKIKGEKKRSASVSGRFFSKGNSRQDGEDKLSRPALRNAVSFTANASTRPILPQKLKAKASRLFRRDGGDKLPRPALRNAVSFTANASTRPILPQKLKAKASRLFKRKKEGKKEVPKKEESEDVEGMFHPLTNPSNSSVADITTDMGTTGRRSRAGSIWNHNEDSQQDAPDVYFSNPFLRSVRSISSFVNPLNLRRSRSNINTNAQLNEQLNEDSDEQSNEPPEPANETSVPAVPAATAPTSEARGRSFKLFRRRPSTSHMHTTEHVDELLNKLSEELSDELPLPSMPAAAVPRSESRSRLFTPFRRRPSASPMNATEPTTEPSVPAAAAPKSESRSGLFGLLKRNKTKKQKFDAQKLDAQQIDAMFSDLSLLFNDSSATVNEFSVTVNDASATAGVDPNASAETVVMAEMDSNSSTETITAASSSNTHAASATVEVSSTTRPGSATVGTSSNTRSGSAAGGTRTYGYHSVGRNYVPPSGGSIFGPRGGRRDGRGSLAHLTGQEREARDRALRERATREKEGVRDMGQLGLNRVTTASSSVYEDEEEEEEEYDEDDGEGGYVV